MSFKRSNSVKASLNIGQPDYFQEFWTLHSLVFNDVTEFTTYEWVIPVYVYSLNDIWDASMSFDISPIDYSKEKNKNKSWEWRVSKTRESIGVDIFNNEEEAWEKWRETFKSNPGINNSRESIMEKRKRHLQQMKKE